MGEFNLADFYLCVKENNLQNVKVGNLIIEAVEFFEWEDGSGKENIWFSACQSCADKVKTIAKGFATDDTRGSGCCMIKGCDKEADCYVDFAPDPIAGNSHRD